MKAFRFYFANGRGSLSPVTNKVLLQRATTRLRQWLLLWACLMMAALLNLTANAGEGFQVKQGLFEVPEVGTVASCVVSSGGYKFTFVPPRDGIVKNDPEERTVNVATEDNKCAISLHITKNYAGSKPKEEALKAHVQELYPEGAVFSSMQCPTGAGLVPGFDVVRSIGEKLRMTTRVVFVPYAGGTVEVSFTTPTASFFEERQVMGAFLGSIRVEEEK